MKRFSEKMRVKTTTESARSESERSRHALCGQRTCRGQICHEKTPIATIILVSTSRFSVGLR
ncbi:hypothetical protein DKP76_15190 [Falsochrobactrum shanghaiense]|uniref:Uncharacterized protein n=1 Tax=Falsochrobactrum shanghaiense TaxID=2201899 RepID=A0A316J4J6_9HYPH|nr:hypothetical protein DKP76_15190 [Falsochrobactrum shanghaiense]